MSVFSSASIPLIDSLELKVNGFLVVLLCLLKEMKLSWGDGFIRRDSKLPSHVRSFTSRIIRDSETFSSLFLEVSRGLWPLLLASESLLKPFDELLGSFERNLDAFPFLKCYIEPGNVALNFLLYDLLSSGNCELAKLDSTSTAYLESISSRFSRASLFMFTSRNSFSDLVRTRVF